MSIFIKDLIFSNFEWKESLISRSRYIDLAARYPRYREECNEKTDGKIVDTDIRCSAYIITVSRRARS